jgi:hypothetical protein
VRSALITEAVISSRRCRRASSVKGCVLIPSRVTDRPRSRSCGVWGDYGVAGEELEGGAGLGLLLGS